MKERQLGRQNKEARAKTWRRNPGPVTTRGDGPGESKGAVPAGASWAHGRRTPEGTREAPGGGALP